MRTVSYAYNLIIWKNCYKLEIDNAIMSININPEVTDYLYVDLRLCVFVPLCVRA